MRNFFYNVFNSLRNTVFETNIKSIDKNNNDAKTPDMFYMFRKHQNI